MVLHTHERWVINGYEFLQLNLNHNDHEEFVVAMFNGYVGPNTVVIN